MAKTIDLELTRAEVEVLELEARLRELGLNTDCEFERSLGGRLFESLPDA